ncbi:hypothetical protein FOCC_FOCC002586 [Frankliniella occidentalis]|nr:hypothetical protein FOCC_FOCC002586 [Frankliniella occidentalis]
MPSPPFPPDSGGSTSRKSAKRDKDNTSFSYPGGNMGEVVSAAADAYPMEEVLMRMSPRQGRSPYWPLRHPALENARKRQRTMESFQPPQPKAMTAEDLIRALQEKALRQQSEEDGPAAGAIRFGGMLGRKLYFSPKRIVAILERKYLNVADDASLMMLVVPVGEAVAVLFMEKWGRVRALQLALVPFCVGSIVIALADSFSLILVGKVLVGVSLAVGTSPASIYVTEVARPDLRGALITAGPLIGAAGLLIAYAAGAVVAWRGVSWCCCAVAAVPLVLLTFCCPESPVWLVQTGQLEKAERSLRRLAPTDCSKEEYAARELQALVLTTRRRGGATVCADGVTAAPRRSLYTRSVHALKKGTTALLRTRSARRPLWLLCVLMLLQQFSGSYVLLFYAVTFFQDVQSSVDDYTAAALVGLLRLVMAVVTLPLLSRFGRRQLLIWSAAIMCASMLTSGFFSRRWPGAAAAAGSAAGGGGVDDLEGLNLEDLGHIGGARWVPPLCVLVYVCSSCIGVLSVPWILAAELFPQEVRGTGQAVILSLAHVFMFAALQSYRELNAWLACVVANSFYLPDGAVLGYSAILIPQLELPKSEITVTRLQTAWLTSLMMLVVPVGEAVAVLFMEKWGRVRALQLALVPFCVGSIVIALADSFSLILVGKVLVGVSLGSDGVQWLYATVCAATVLFVWLVVPETQSRTGEQIETFFENHILYMGRARISKKGGKGEAAEEVGCGAPAKGEDAPGKANDIFFLECREEPEGAVEESSCVTHL